ncbi:hypothetical protein [Paraburkholderia caffeinilytica]|uniref:Uncharacterized protein n=1 Tax=Paraburkholderia caffeinilytica TaxID=1761016 RepID=A0ABQ1MLB3_9BURK|nr:hypothetical protein [Paraburkholderia caffeinilytica]GGC39258.1 hypothetical protein GCM10011400_27440 [Paraburkholderia caffeinilytica]
MADPGQAAADCRTDFRIVLNYKNPHDAALQFDFGFSRTGFVSIFSDSTAKLYKHQKWFGGAAWRQEQRRRNAAGRNKGSEFVQELMDRT